MVKSQTHTEKPPFGRPNTVFPCLSTPPGVPEGVEQKVSTQKKILKKKFAKKTKESPPVKKIRTPPFKGPDAKAPVSDTN